LKLTSDVIPQQNIKRIKQNEEIASQVLFWCLTCGHLLGNTVQIR